MYGEVGNDTIYGGNGTDLLNGGDGLDFRSTAATTTTAFYTRDTGIVDFLNGGAGMDSAEMDEEDIEDLAGGHRYRSPLRLRLDGNGCRRGARCAPRRRFAS